jgi:uncharacterized protein DUF3592
MGVTFRFQLSWGAAALLFCGAALVLGALTARSVRQLRAELATWPRVRAHVDSADVVSAIDPRRDRYAARLWLSYRTAGVTYTAPVTDNDYTSFYGSAVRAAAAASRSGTVVALVNPQEPRALTLLPASGWQLFIGPLLLAVMAAACAGLGLFCLWRGRQHGFDAPAGTPYTEPASAGWGVLFAGILALMFAAGAGAAAYIGRHQAATWRRVQARVDSADVVQAPRGTSGRFNSGQRSPGFAVRRWLRYSIGGREYRAPLASSFATSNYGAVARAAAAAGGQVMPALVSPGDPYRILSDAQITANTVWLPLIFGGCALGCFAVMGLFWRLRSRGHARTTRRRSPRAAHDVASGVAR